jgi:pimeloyl-[acyl-carrier protein] synthase
MEMATIPKIFDMSATNIDSNDPYGLVTSEVFDNPHALYHMLRYSEPVHWSEILNAWVLTRYEDVMLALKDPRFSNAMRRAVGTARLSPELRAKMAPIDRFLLLWVLNLDDPEHHKLRVLLSKAFTPRAMDNMRPRIKQISDELIDAVINDGHMDFVKQFAYPLPCRVIAELFGMPEESYDALSSWSRTISTFFEVGPAKVSVLEDMVRTVEEMTQYLRAVVEENRAHPRDNILGALIRAEEAGSVLSEDQLLATGIMILFAGHDSTVNLIGSGMYSLLTHPDELALLKARPELIRGAVDEFLRFESPVMRHDRVLREDIELHGHILHKGQRVIVALGAANRDPAQFVNPDELSITRKNAGRHSTFGNGAHSCLGAALACTQAEIAINLVLDRLPAIHLTTERARWREHFNFRGLKTLPVEF